MKAPVGLLSDRTVLRSKMEVPRPDKFTLTRLDFCGNLSQQFNITYLFRVPARLPKEPEQVFNFLSLHNEPEPRPSRKGWSGSGCCVAIFYCQIQHRTLKTERPSAWDTRRRPRKGEPENAAGRGQESHAGRTAHPTSCVQNEHMRRNGRLSTRWGRRNQCGQNVYIIHARFYPVFWCFPFWKVPKYRNA